MNKRGLANILQVATGLDKAIFDEFCLGFTGSAELWDIIDCGKGKEGADSKIKGMLLEVLVWFSTPSAKVCLQLLCASTIRCLNAPLSSLVVHTMPDTSINSSKRRPILQVKSPFH